MYSSMHHGSIHLRFLIPSLPVLLTIRPTHPACAPVCLHLGGDLCVVHTSKSCARSRYIQPTMYLSIYSCMSNHFFMYWCIDVLLDWLIGWLAGWLVGWLVAWFDSVRFDPIRLDLLTDWMNWLINSLNDNLIEWLLIGSMTGWLTHLLTHSLTLGLSDRLTDWLAGCLAGWLNKQQNTPCFGCLWVDLVTVQETLQGSQRRVLSEQQCYEHGGQVPFITSRCVLQLIHQFEDHMCRAEQEMGNESNALGTSHLSSRMGCEHHFHHQRRQICCIQGCIKRTWRTGSPF